MTMGTNEQEHPRARTRKTTRDAVICALTGMMSALLFVMALPTADNWFRILGTCLLGIGAVVYVAKSIITLRQDDHALSE